MTSPAPELSWKAYRQSVRDAWDQLRISVRRVPRPTSTTSSDTPMSPALQVGLFVLVGYTLGLLAAVWAVLLGGRTGMIWTSLPVLLGFAYYYAFHVKRRRLPGGQP